MHDKSRLNYFLRMCFWCSLICSLSFLTSCKNKQSIDVSDIDVDLKFKRFEKELFALSAANYKIQIDSLQKKYPVLFPFYFGEIGGWQFSHDSSDALKDSVWQYVRSPYSQALYDSTMLRFADLLDFTKDLRHAFQYYKHYFPNAAIPEVNSLINGPSAFTIGDNLLCVSLDKYLGPSSAFYRYEAEPIPQYMLNRFKPEYMTSNCIEVVATNTFEMSPASKKLLDKMIYKGKIIYFKKKLLPLTPDSVITGYASKDLEWCSDNEPEIWKFFIEHNLLYSADPLEYGKYITEGPSTSGMPPEAPGNIGSWVGWRIVTRYMEKNADVSLQQLMNDSNSQQILSGSKYKPRR